jgi:hypothetical protein
MKIDRLLCRVTINQSAVCIVRGTRGAVRVLETKDEVSPARLGTMNKAGSTPSNTVVKREQFPALAGCSDGAALRAAGAPTTSMIAWAMGEISIWGRGMRTITALQLRWRID